MTATIEAMPAAVPALLLIDLEFPEK